MKTKEEIEEKAVNYITAYGGNMLTAGPTFLMGKKCVDCAYLLRSLI
ncbi:MAG: hypothetical protein HY361_00720 [Candidatus Aenigmarchaeota archaeon]|nr:hypothetical protein [Candidatus Aenigmarchaeota archaeon]